MKLSFLSALLFLTILPLGFTQSLSPGINLHTGVNTPFRMATLGHANGEIDAKPENALNYSNLFIGEFYIKSQTQGHKNWHKLYKNPSLDFIFSYYNIGYKDELEDLYSLSVGLNTPLKTSKKQKLTFKVTTGLAYTKWYYTYGEHPYNSAFSQELNAEFRLGLVYEQIISQKFAFTGNFEVRHFSNGSMSVPNVGLNLITLGGGIRFLDKKEYDNWYKPNYNRKQIVKEIPNPKKWHVGLYWNYSKKKVLKSWESKTVRSYFLEITKDLTRTNAAILSIDYFEYDVSTIREIFHHRLFRGSDPYKRVVNDPRQIGLSLGHELYIGRFSFLTLVGYNIHDPENPHETPFYQRVNLRWYPFKNYLSLNAGLKVINSSADATSFGVGLRF